jgi:hypothetical protein
VLKSKHDRVYFQSAPSKIEDPDNPGVYISTPFPYIVYDLPNSVDDGSMEQFVLDIDAWDNKTDTTTLETLIDSIDKELHRKTVMINGVLAVTFYRENRLSLIDDDPTIRRRKYIYQIRTHE